jgi:hypothetical protein
VLGASGSAGSALSKAICCTCRHWGSSDPAHRGRRSREENDLAELQAQVKRLRSIVDDIDAALKPADYDLVGALTGLCLTNQIAVPPTRLELAQAELLREARDIVWGDFDLPPLPSVHGAAPTPSSPTLHALIANMPPWDVVERLAHQYVNTATWVTAVDRLLTPVWYRDLEGLYEAAFVPQPSASRLGEILAWLSSAAEINDMRLRQAVAYGVTINDEPMQKTAHYEIQAQAVLEMAACVEHPDLHCVRARAFLAR